MCLYRMAGRAGVDPRRLHARRAQHANPADCCWPHLQAPAGGSVEEQFCVSSWMVRGQDLLAMHALPRAGLATPATHHPTHMMKAVLASTSWESLDCTLKESLSYRGTSWDCGCQ